jgi:hypothetical protein
MVRRDPLVEEQKRGKVPDVEIWTMNGNRAPRRLYAQVRTVRPSRWRGPGPGNSVLI